VTERGTSLDHLAPELRETLERLPKDPGVYLLKDHGAKVIYVGKAKSLHSRVRSYFTRSHDERAFVPLLERLVGEIDTIVTANEKEALLLENTLIKQHHPRFNVMLRDDKSFLVLRLDVAARFPRLEITRRIRDDGARYFGPYHSATDCRQTLRLVNRFFQLRVCSDRALDRRSRPCLQYQIQRCLGPCVLEVDPARYRQQVEDVTLFLRGRGDELVRDLEARMLAAATALDFEHAAGLRDQIAAVQSSLQLQHAVSNELLDRDVFGLHREGDRVEFVVLLVRGGKLVGRRPFSFSDQEFPDEEVLSALISRYYERGEAVPQQILVPLPLEDVEVKQQWLAELRGGAVQILQPRRGDKRSLLDLAQRNAQANFLSRRRRAADVDEALAKLQRRLRLARPPRRIECFDISSLQGQLVVASMVVLVDGEPQHASYRRFKIATPDRAPQVSADGYVDDFAAMYEALSRRLRRAREAQPGWELPDLIVVDGGKAQLSMALAALRDVGLAGEGAPDIVALAKERPDDPAEVHAGVLAAVGVAAEERAPTSTPDRVYLPHVKDPVRLRPNTAELFLLARVRDEAHRFAVTYHRQLRRRRTLRSGLEDIPGIGPRRRRELLRALGSLRRIREASLEELAAVTGMSSAAAEAVVAYFAGARSEAAATEVEEAGGEPGGDQLVVGKMPDGTVGS
jgi:excinuclease ABC subunit C